MRLTVVPTADVDVDELHALLLAAFDGEFADSDLDHCLGGVHVLARDAAGALLGHAAVVGRRLQLAGRAVRTGYVEAVATAPAARGRGVGWAVMTEVARLVHGGHRLGALAASEAGMGLYRAQGWVPWRGPLFALTPQGPVPTPDDSGSVLVLPRPGVPLDVDTPIACDWRDGDAW